MFKNVQSTRPLSSHTKRVRSLAGINDRRQREYGKPVRTAHGRGDGGDARRRRCRERSKTSSTSPSRFASTASSASTQRSEQANSAASCSERSARTDNLTEFLGRGHYGHYVPSLVDNLSDSAPSSSPRTPSTNPRSRRDSCRRCSSTSRCWSNSPASKSPTARCTTLRRRSAKPPRLAHRVRQTSGNRVLVPERSSPRTTERPRKLRRRARDSSSTTYRDGRRKRRPRRTRRADRRRDGRWSTPRTRRRAGPSRRTSPKSATSPTSTTRCSVSGPTPSRSRCLQEPARGRCRRRRRRRRDARPADELRDGTRPVRHARGVPPAGSGPTRRHQRGRGR